MRADVCLRGLAAALALGLVVARPAVAADGPRLLEFRAPDCVACDAMADALTAEPAWAALTARAPVQTLTLDNPEAATLKVGRVPTWLLVNAKGEELGRIAGAQPAAAAIAELELRLQARVTAQARSAQASEITMQGAAALAERLARFHAANDGDGGFAWWLKLPIAVRGQQSIASPAVLHWRNRIELLRAAQRGRVRDVIDAGHKVLDVDAVGCDRGLELARVLDGTASLAAEARRSALAPFRAQAEAALPRDWLSETPACVDGLPLVLATADLLAVLGDRPAARRLLEQALAVADRRIASGDPRHARALPRHRAALQGRLDALAAAAA